MPYDPARHHRRSIRLKGFDYSLPGHYFVTVCVRHFRCVFGEVVADEMRLNRAGIMVDHAWQALPSRFDTLELHVWQLMPNHFHAILELEHRTDRDIDLASMPTVSGIIGAWKSITTNDYIAGVKTDGWPSFPKRLWQRDFFERIIRNERELEYIRNYILNNPRNWMEDRFYPRG
ncbi:MAG: hypothetical protein KDD73_09865 [Anaerolineales bacterium]|nr:hypothetical protein [Anaerolineales bacterium]MCB9127058.1 transposase [Ardenticatenales bacterium]MCB9172417.1 transposase [Ardenticatenales bacterium]